MPPRKLYYGIYCNYTLLQDFNRKLSIDQHLTTGLPNYVIFDTPTGI